MEEFYKYELDEKTKELFENINKFVKKFKFKDALELLDQG